MLQGLWGNQRAAKWHMRCYRCFKDFYGSCGSVLPGGWVSGCSLFSVRPAAFLWDSVQDIITESGESTKSSILGPSWQTLAWLFSFFNPVPHHLCKTGPECTAAKQTPNISIFGEKEKSGSLTLRDEAAALRGKVGFIFACRVIRRCSENLSRPLPRRVYRGAARRSINHLRSHKERSVLVGRDLCRVVCDAHQCATLRGFLADASRAIFEKSPPGQSFCSFLQQRAWPSVFTADDGHCFRWLLTFWFFFFFQNLL